MAAGDPGTAKTRAWTRTAPRLPVPRPARGVPERAVLRASAVRVRRHLPPRWAMLPKARPGAASAPLAILRHSRWPWRRPPRTRNRASPDPSRHRGCPAGWQGVGGSRQGPVARWSNSRDGIRSTPRCGSPSWNIGPIGGRLAEAIRRDLRPPPEDRSRPAPLPAGVSRWRRGWIPDGETRWLEEAGDWLTEREGAGGRCRLEPAASGGGWGRRGCVRAREGSQRIPRRAPLARGEGA
jgi:hypothetical protein